MASALHSSPSQPVAAEGANGTARKSDDPFTSTPTMQSSRPHRYSSFDTGLFADNHPSSSPSHAKRALESHLAETERRLHEASKLGTTLVEQRQKISARLREVELQQNQDELAPELRQRLRDIEKEYNEVGRESARAFLGPRTDPVGTTSDAETPFALDGKVRNIFSGSPCYLTRCLETRQPSQVLKSSNRLSFEVECPPKAAKPILQPNSRYRARCSNQHIFTLPSPSTAGYAFRER